MNHSFKTLLAAGLALVGSIAVQPAPAEAQSYWALVIEAAGVSPL
jgi:hypothetical protein